MAICMIASGMTEMGHEEPVATESLDVDSQHTSESMDADDDPEVHYFYIYNDHLYITERIILQFTQPVHNHILMQTILGCQIYLV